MTHTYNLLKSFITAIRLQSHMLETQGDMMACVDADQIQKSVEELPYE